jgi:hypothetical protein
MDFGNMGAYRPGATTRANPFNTSGINNWDDKFRTIQKGMSEQLWDFQSPFYQSYRNYLAQSIPGIGLGPYLSILQSGGGNQAGSMAQALALKGNADRQRTDAINLGTRGFAQQNVGQAGSLIGNAQDSMLQQRQLEYQKEIAEMQQGGFMDWTGSILGTLGGGLLGGPFGAMLGGSLFGGMAQGAR